MAKTKKKDLSSQVSIYFLGQVAALLVTFLVPIVLARAFSRTEYGLYAQIVLINVFFLNVLEFGLGDALFYYVPRERENRSYFVTNTFLCFLAAGLVFLAVLTCFREQLAQLMDADELTMLLPLAGLVTLFQLVSSPLESLLIIDSKAERASLVTFLSQVTRSVFVITFVLVFKSIVGAVLGLVCFSLLRFLVYSYLVYSHFGFVLNQNNATHFRRQRNYALPLGFSAIMANTNRRIDKMILAGLFAPEVYAIYHVANFKMPMSGMFYKSVAEVILPRAVRLLKDGKVDEFVKLWRALLVRLFFVGCATFFALQLVAVDLVTLVYTSKYEASVPIFRILLLLSLCQMFRYGIILRTLGDTKSIFKSNLLAFVISVPLTVILVSFFGMHGAAISAVTVLFINGVSQVRYSVIGLGRTITEIFPVQTLLQLMAIGASVSVVLWMLQPLIQNQLLRFVLSGSTFVIAFTGICRMTQVIDIFDEKLVKRVLQKLNPGRAVEST